MSNLVYLTFFSYLKTLIFLFRTVNGVFKEILNLFFLFKSKPIYILFFHVSLLLLFKSNSKIGFWDIFITVEHL